MKSAVFTLLLTSGAATGEPAGMPPDAVDLLVGNWACETGACPDPEIEFAVEDGARVFNSWLNERPSASEGTWSLDGDLLRIECCEGIEYEFQLIRVTAGDLVLRDAVTSEEAILTRIGPAAAP